jgi:hypothetical protein
MKATDLTATQLWEAAKTMEEYGGGFASALARAFFRADSHNTQRLLTAFDHLFMHYHEWNLTKGERNELQP